MLTYDVAVGSGERAGVAPISALDCGHPAGDCFATKMMRDLGDRVLRAAAAYQAPRPSLLPSSDRPLYGELSPAGTDVLPPLCLMASLPTGRSG